MRHPTLLVLLLGAACASAHAQDAAGVALVTTAAARQGSLPDIITAYGAAAPAQNGGMAVSLQQDGRVAAILVTQGERVAAGTRLLTFNAAATTTSAYAQAVTALSLAQTQRGHAAQLLAQRLATRDQLAQADKAVLDARATLAALTQQGANRPRTDVTAPFDAVVEAIQVAQGDRVAAGAPLLTLTRLDGLVVTVGIDPALFARVRPGQAVRLQPMDGRTALAGRVLRVDGVVNAKSRLLDVDVSVPPGDVISGTLFRADITVGMLSGWLVPHDSVLDDEHGFFLFQVDAGAGAKSKDAKAGGTTNADPADDAKAGQKAVRLDVQLLASRDSEDLVEGKLDRQRAVVVEGATQLSDGDAVRTDAAPASPTPAPAP